jgi:endonuclease YncB( thermonuclease family)
MPPQRVDDASTHVVHVGGELAWWKRGTGEPFSVTTPFGPSAFEKRVVTPGNRRFVRTALAILGLMALATATVWIVLFMFVRPARGDIVDARMFYVIDRDTLALAGERIRLARRREPHISPSGAAREEARERALSIVTGEPLCGKKKGG